MNVIVDTSIIISALVKKSDTRNLLFEIELNFLYPEFLLEEIRRHYDEILLKAGLNKERFDELLSQVLNRLNLIPNEIIMKNKDKALEIMQNIDPKDAIFISGALGYPNSIIWSNDKHFKKQKQKENKQKQKQKELKKFNQTKHY